MVVDTQPQEKKLPVHKSIYLLPNLITSLSMFMGFLSMVWAVQSRFEEAGLAIVLSALLDGMDGKVARLTHTASEFGVQYDSLACSGSGSWRAWAASAWWWPSSLPPAVPCVWPASTSARP